MAFTHISSTAFLLFFMSIAVRSSVAELRPLAQEKTAHIHFFFHDNITGRNATTIKVVSGPKNESIGTFGDIRVMDAPLTEDPEPSSKLIGKAQGIFSVATIDHARPALMMAFNFVFTAGEHNGSTVAVLGRNEIFLAVREMPIIGGTGAFRLARGYVQLSTYWFNSTTGDSILEYNVYVMHY